MPGQHRRFALIRDRDVTGVSGTGLVAEGIQWGDGSVALRWCGEKPSTVVWPDLESAIAVHSHDGATRVEWSDAGNFNDRLPEVIRIVRGGNTCSLTIDGVQFPWFVARDSVSTFVRAEGMPAVSVELPCVRLEIVDDMNGGTEAT